MTQTLRIVVDSNVLLSGLLFPASVPARALLKAQGHLTIASESTCEELMGIMERSRFDRYMDREIRLHLAREYRNACRLVPIPTPIRACRDPRDDKFLEVAVHGRADLILTGDEDLLALHPFQGISILTPAQFLDLDLS